VLELYGCSVPQFPHPWEGLQPCDNVPAFSTLPRDQQRCGDHGRAVSLLRERLCQRDGHPHGSPGHQAADELRGSGPAPACGHPCICFSSESRALLLAAGWEPLRNCWLGRDPFPFPIAGCSTSLVVRLGRHFFCKYVENLIFFVSFGFFECNFSRA